MRYYRKMLFTFLSLAITYTVLVDVIFFLSYRRAAYGDFNRTLDAVAKQAAEYTDNQLRAFQEVGMLLRSTEPLGKYLQEDPTAPDRYNRFQLYKYVNSIYGVAFTKKRDMAVTKLVDDYAVMFNTTGSVESMLEAFAITPAQLDQAVASFSGQIGQPMQVLQSVDEKENPLYTLISRQWVGRINPFYLLVSYTHDQLFSLQSGTLAVVHQGKLWLSAGDLDMVAVTDLLAGAQTPLIRREMPSAIPGFAYVYWDKVPGDIGATSLMIVGAGVLALACSALIMGRITRRMYSPIADTLSLSGVESYQGDEFKGLREAITSLKSDVQTMTHSLSQYYDTVENKFYHDLLTGLIPMDKVEEVLRQFGIPHSPGPYVAVLVQFEENLELGTDLGHAALYEVRAGLRHRLQQGRHLLRAIDINMTTQGFIFRQASLAALQETLRGILLTVEPEYGLETTAYIGHPVESLAQINVSFRTALRLREESTYDTVRAKVITPENKPKPVGSQHNVHYPLNTEQVLINAVIHGKTSLMENTLQTLIRTNAQEYPGNFSPLSLMLTATINRILDGVKRKATEIFQDDTIIYLEFRSCESYEAMEQRALALFTVLAGYLALEAKKSTQTLEKQMTSFILAHYHRDISLFDLADHVNMSKNYVSTLFRNSTGQTFKDYLGILRHKKALEAIEADPDIKIQSVAKAVGCSPDTLLRLFMRYSGMSPSDYQQTCKEKGGSHNP